jgi:hypothetical protein
MCVVRLIANAVIREALRVPPFSLGSWAELTQLPGKGTMRSRFSNKLHQLSKERYVMAYWIALIHTGLKESDQAFASLDRAYQEHSPHLVVAKVDPRLDSLRSDPRFGDLLRRMNVPPFPIVDIG